MQYFMNRMDAVYVDLSKKDIFMKKLFSAVTFATFVMRASEEMQDVRTDMSEVMSDLESAASEMMSSLSLKDRILIHWMMLSPMHKMIVAGVVIALILFVISRLMKCRKKCS